MMHASLEVEAGLKFLAICYKKTRLTAFFHRHPAIFGLFQVLNNIHQA